MLSFRMIAFLSAGRTKLEDIQADTANEAWGLATRLARRLGANGFELVEG
jgi:hypothetical protein